jgi:predicted HTH transcriptional regulator
VISSLISKLVERNPKIFKSKGMIDIPAEKIKKLINEGEHKGLEFKSTLRTNLHTNQVDKRMEHSVLKTIVAYLNSHGGTLLVGVDNDGNILGTEKDKFDNRDKLHLHFTNMLKNHVGSEFLPFIKFDLIQIGNRSVLRVDCDRSEKHVFLKLGDEEEFYIRNGPSSMKLSGSSLVDYIQHQFSGN